MAEERKPKASTRTVNEIHAELQQANAKFVKLLGAVEADNRKVALRTAHAANITKIRQAEWQRHSPGTPFDPSVYEDEPLPVPNQSIQEELHAIHYTIAQLTDELNAASRNRSKADSGERV